MPADALAVLRTDSKDSIYFRVGTRDGAFVAGDADLPMPSTAASNPGRPNAVYRGNPVRLVAYRTYAGNDEITVTMGETLHKRSDFTASGSSAARSRPTGSCSASSSRSFGSACSLSLQPLRDMEREITKRSAQDLTPVERRRHAERDPQPRRRAQSLVRDGDATTPTSQRQFLDNAAHQLRTPLAGIQAQVEVLCADEPDAKRRERLQRVLDAARGSAAPRSSC